MLELSLAEATLRLGQSLDRLAGGAAGGSESPERLRRQARTHLAAAVARLSPLVENGSLVGSDADLLAEARRALAAAETG